MENRHQAPGAERERQHHSGDSHCEGLPANSDQLLQLTLKTGEKQQCVETQLSDRLE